MADKEGSHVRELFPASTSESSEGGSRSSRPFSPKSCYGKKRRIAPTATHTPVNKEGKEKCASNCTNEKVPGEIQPRKQPKRTSVLPARFRHGAPNHAKANYNRVLPSKSKEPKKMVSSKAEAIVAVTKRATRNSSKAAIPVKRATQNSSKAETGGARGETSVVSEGKGADHGQVPRTRASERILQKFYDQKALELDEQMHAKHMAKKAKANFKAKQQERTAVSSPSPRSRRRSRGQQPSSTAAAVSSPSPRSPGRSTGQQPSSTAAAVSSPSPRSPGRSTGEQP